jgi:4-hydroxymandelate oxidase
VSAALYSAGSSNQLINAEDDSRAVLVGRPILWGLAVDGAAGVHHVLELLRAELTLAMMLAGRPDMASIDGSLVRSV